MDVGRIEDGVDEVGILFSQWLAVITVRNGTAHRRRGSTKHSVRLHGAAAHQTVKFKLEGLTAIALEILAQEDSSRLTRVDHFLLVVQALDIGGHDRSRGCIIGSLNLDITEAFVIGHQITARVGIGVLHLYLVQCRSLMLPGDVALGIEQDAVTCSHQGHLGQVVGIVVAQHRFLQRHTAVAEHMNLGQIAAQSPVADIIG